MISRKSNLNPHIVINISKALETESPDRGKLDTPTSHREPMEILQVFKLRRQIVMNVVILPS